MRGRLSTLLAILEGSEASLISCHSFSSWETDQKGTLWRACFRQRDGRGGCLLSAHCSRDSDKEQGQYCSAAEHSVP